MSTIFNQTKFYYTKSHHSSENRDESTINFLIALFKKINYRETYLKIEKQESLFLSIKKGNKKNINNYKPITLLNLSLKIFTKVLQNCLYNTYESLFGNEQAGFNRLYFCPLRIADLFLDCGKKIYYCFIDFKQAFDSTDRKNIIRI